MASTTIALFASELKMPPELLLIQFKAAGVLKSSANDKITKEDKDSLLAHLRRAHGVAPDAEKKKILLIRKQDSDVKKINSIESIETFVGGRTRQEMTNIAALIDINQIQKAEKRLITLILETNLQGIKLVEPELKALIDRFFHKRRVSLSALLENKLSPQVEKRPTNSFKAPQTLGDKYSARLDTLRNKNIFKWTTSYRDTFLHIFLDSFVELKNPAQFESNLDSLSRVIVNHSTEIFSRGYDFQTSRGLDIESAEFKSISGFQQFLYLIISIFQEQSEKIKNSKEAKIIWSIVSNLLVSVIRGYGKAKFGEKSGWEVLSCNLKMWLIPIGFCRGLDAQDLFNEFPALIRNEMIWKTIVPTLLALEQLANSYHEREIFLPRFCKLQVSEPSRLDLRLGLRKEEHNSELLVSIFFSKEINNPRVILDALSCGAIAIIGGFSEEILSSFDSVQLGHLFDAREVCQKPEQVHNFSEQIKVGLESYIRDQIDVEDRTLILRNFAKDFPLEDPNYRKQFIVERHSVRRLLEEFEGSTGVHLWCSVRRSGKTTAATSLADTNSSSLVVLQTMDHQPHNRELNILLRRVDEVLVSEINIPPDFFEGVVKECVLAQSTTENEQEKIVFLVDEYETLFQKLTILFARFLY